MKDLDKKIVALMYPLFGAFLGFLVFTFGTGGWWYVFAGKVKSKWVGPMGLVICLAVGAVLGWIAYWQRHRELEGAEDAILTLEQNPLLKKRLGVVLFCLIALYFVWQLAKSV
jgi:hypothetical protein